MPGPQSVDAYLKGLPADRREALQAVRNVILANLGKGFEEGIQYGMIGYFVPLSVYPPGYHCAKETPLPFAGLASQKNHMSMYFMGLYSNPTELTKFQDAWKATGRRLDMGKSCIRFRKLEDVPLKVLGQTVRRLTVRKFIQHYEAEIESQTSRTRKAASKKKAAGKKKAAAKKKAAGKKKAAAKKKVAGKKKVASKKKAASKNKVAGKKKAAGRKKS